MMAMEKEVTAVLDRQRETDALQNPFKRRLRPIDADPIDAKCAKSFLPLHDLSSINLPRLDGHYGYKLRIGCLELGAGIGRSGAIATAMKSSEKTTVDRPNQLTVLLGYDGEASLQDQTQNWRLQSGDCLVLTSPNSGQNDCQYAGEPMAWLGGLYSVVYFRLDPQRLLHTVSLMGGGPAAALAEKLSLHHPKCWTLSTDPTQISLQDMLRELIVKVDQLLDISPILLERLQLDDQIYRLLAAMIVPELCEEGVYSRLRRRESKGRDSFDDLIDYIKANLDQPLNLTLLESQSHYSRRTLQYAFRERLGCTATQWIRSQRLDLARQLLEHPRAGDTVASIAIASGYRSISLFSVDFQQRFHLKPSDLLREARASSRPPGG